MIVGSFRTLNYKGFRFPYGKAKILSTTEKESTVDEAWYILMTL